MSVSQRYLTSWLCSVLLVLRVLFLTPLLWGPPLDIPISTTVNQIFSYFCPALLLQHHHQHLWTVSYSSSLSLFFPFLIYLIVLFISFSPRWPLWMCASSSTLPFRNTHTSTISTLSISLLQSNCIFSSYWQCFAAREVSSWSSVFIVISILTPTLFLLLVYFYLSLGLRWHRPYFSPLNQYMLLSFEPCLNWKLDPNSLIDWSFSICSAVTTVFCALAFPRYVSYLVTHALCCICSLFFLHHLYRVHCIFISFVSIPCILLFPAILLLYCYSYYVVLYSIPSLGQSWHSARIFSTPALF